MNRPLIIAGLAGIAMFVVGVALMDGAFSDPEATCSPTPGRNADACETTTAQVSSTEPTAESGGTLPTNSDVTQPPGTATTQLSDTVTTHASNTTPPSNPETTQPSGTPTTEPSDTTNAGSGECSIVLGMSQIEQVYQGSSLDTSGKWMSHVSTGTALGKWAAPSGRPWVDFKVRNDCGNPTHASFGFNPGGRALDPDLSTAVANIKSFYPTVETVDVWLLVGAKEDGRHVTCTINGRTVRATMTHTSYQEELATFLAGHSDILAGPDIDVSCDGFLDKPGHLSASGKAAAGAQFDAFNG